MRKTSKGKRKTAKGKMTYTQVATLGGQTRFKKIGRKGMSEMGKLGAKALWSGKK